MYIWYICMVLTFLVNFEPQVRKVVLKSLTPLSLLLLSLIVQPGSLKHITTVIVGFCIYLVFALSFFSPLYTTVLYVLIFPSIYKQLKTTHTVISDIRKIIPFFSFLY